LPHVTYINDETKMTDANNTSILEHSSNLVCAADLGGTHLRVALVDPSGNIHFRLKQSTPQDASPEGIMHSLVSAVRECETHAKQNDRKQVSAVSVVVPGTVNVDQGIVVKAPNLPSLDGFHLSEQLTSQLGFRSVLENDANAAAVGEMWMGAGRGHSAIVCVTLGTGVGGGIILNGKLWRGVDGAAAEIGHMCVDPFGGVACGCGSRGCLEVYASATAIVRMTKEASPRHPDSTLDMSKLTSEAIFCAGKHRDELALEVFKRMGVYLGIGIANLINILNPEMIVIGGGVANGWELFDKSMRQQVAKRAFPLLAARVQIVQAECGDDAGLLGAARLGFQN
jgi:glucokinase